MKKYLLLFFVMVASVLGVCAQDDATGGDAVITIKTSNAVGTELEISASAVSNDDPLTIDWGDGVEKNYFATNFWNTDVTAKAEIKSQTIKISGNLKGLDLKELAVTSFECSAAPALEELNLSGNQLAKLTLADMPALKTLNLSKNQLDSYSLDIDGVAATVADLNISGNQLTVFDLRKFASLAYFNASENADLTTVLFPDGSENLREINMSHCDIAHFYAISLPSLSTLKLGYNSLYEDEETVSFEDGDYPRLSTLELQHNMMKVVNLAHYPTLTNVNVSGNMLTRLTVGTLEDLMSLSCADNQLTQLNVTANKQLTSLYCSGNQLTKLDITQQGYMRMLDISNNPITFIDLSNAYGLTAFTASATLCSGFDFTGVNRFGPLRTVDVRNNPNMTAQALNMMFLSMPQRSSASYGVTTLFIAGCPGAEQCYTDDINGEYQWKTDVVGDGSAQKQNVAITVDATDTGEKDNFEGQYSTDESYSLTRYATEGGHFNLTQWTGSYYENHADLTTTAELGIPAWVVAYPNDGYRFKEVLVNGQSVADIHFTPVADATIKVVFEPMPAVTKFTTVKGTKLGFGVRVAQDATPVAVSWGSGDAEDYVVSSEGTTYFDDYAIGSDITIYGDITALVAYSFPDSEELGFSIDNKISAVDFSHNPKLKHADLYGNKLSSINVSMLPDLEYLDVATLGDGELTGLNVGNNPKLATLLCYNNQISALDLTHCPALVKVDAKNNSIADINLSANAKLQYLNLNGNKLSAIDVTGLADLTDLLVTGNSLTSLDVSANPKLLDLSAGSNRLTELDLTANTRLLTLGFQDNYIHTLDLSGCTGLRQVACGNNGMSACELDDFFYTLPTYPDVPSDEIVQGATLRLNEGTEERPNGYDTCDTSIATTKGWTPNTSGDTSGCETAYVTIIPSENGTVKFFDADGNEIKSGDKVVKNTTVTVEATPKPGYTYDGLRIGSRVYAKATSFKVLKYTVVEVGFSGSSAGIDGVSAADLGASVSATDGAISVEAAAGVKTAVYTAAGRLVAGADVEGTRSFAVKAGAYIVKLAAADGQTATVKVVVK